ncbi:secreted RxLR effector protein 161-like [Apium graveolens]|uniref:secreted RxLR effector protein 161-like n=1 Tax=Apium graveolens TaxID=4045 RepID=UPI003D7A079E
METHMLAVKRILRYIQATTNLGIFYKMGYTQELMAYTDSDYVGDINDRKSTSGYVFLLSGGAVAWASKKQPIVTLSTTEAEYVAAASCACQSVWMQRVLNQIKGTLSDSIKIFYDNSSTIKLANNPVFNGRCKHIDVRFHFLKNLVSAGAVSLEYCGTSKQVVDLMTKPLKLDQFEKLRNALGVRSKSKIN